MEEAEGEGGEVNNAGFGGDGSILEGMVPPPKGDGLKEISSNDLSAILHFMLR
jgi:hypothetical protein